jgi:hypothetical protein
LKAREKITRDTRIDYSLFIVLSGLTFLLIFSIIILASVPPISKDALVHHLAVPKLYLKHGGIHEIPSMVFSYYPMNLDLLYLVPLYFGNDIIPKFIHFSFALLTAWLIFNYLKRRTNIVYALIGAIFFLSIPIIVKLSITVYVDLGLIFFSTASLLLLLRWIESGFRIKFLIISAICCGLAMGTKYNGLITLFLLTLFVPFLYSRYSQGIKPCLFEAAGYGILFLFVALLFFSPWMIKNYFWTNNPIFPLYAHWFNPQNAIDRQTIGLFAYRRIFYHETWWQMVLLPVRIFFQGQDGNPQYFDGKLNPFLLLFPFFSFYQIRRNLKVIRNEKKIMLIFSALFFAFAFFSSSLRIRYISPIIPPLVILSIFGIEKMVSIVSRVYSGTVKGIALAIVFLLVSFSLYINGGYIVSQFRYLDPFSYIDGSLSRDEYIDKYRFEYPTIRYINENLPEDARILFIYLGNRGYYCDIEYIFDMNNNRSTLLQLTRRSNDPETIFLRLKGMGITHLLIRYDIFDKWVKAKFAPEDKEILKAFLEKYAKMLFSKWGYGVSRLENFD